MSKIYVTGDTHGSIDIKKLNNTNFTQGKSLTKDDYVIITGDCGIVWNGSNEDKYWQKWLNYKPWTTLFIDGNHENFNLLNAYPVETWNGGKIHKINDSIIHLMRGQVFNINGKKIFTMGGATSIDKFQRKENISWWKEELPNNEEFEEGLKNLEANNWEVDYIITHCCSAKVLKTLSHYCRFYDYELDSLNKYLDVIEERVKYKHWYFGHYHQDINNIVDNHTVIYNRIIKMGDE